MARSKLHRRYGRRKNRSDDYKRNPPLFTELAEYIGPGFVAFAGTRMLTRVAAVALAKHKPSLSRHAGVLASVGSFAAVYFLAHKVKWLERWQSPLAVGAGLATLQTLLQSYFPRLGWIVSDAAPQIAESQQNSALRNLELTDEDPELYTYNDDYNQGRMGRQQHRADARAAGQPARAPNAADPDEDLLSELDLDSDVQDAAGTATMGIFSN